MYIIKKIRTNSIFVNMKKIYNRDILLSQISSKFDISSKLIEILLDISITSHTYSNFRNPNFLETILITSSSSGGF